MSKVINVTRPSMPSFEEYADEIKTIWDTRILTNGGEKNQALERELCSYLGCDNAKLFTNGHLALETAFDALGLKGEVITRPLPSPRPRRLSCGAGSRPCSAMWSLIFTRSTPTGSRRL